MIRTVEGIESPLPLQQQQPPGDTTRGEKKSKGFERLVLVLNFVTLIVSACSSPLLLRLHVAEGGNRKWFTSWLQASGWPILLIPLSLSYHFRRRENLAQDSPLLTTKPYHLTPPLILASAVVGIITGLSSFLYGYGISYLPVSTATLLASTQLVFTASFAFVIVKQKITACSINAVVLLSLGAIVLGIGSDGDRPKGEGRGVYYLGFTMMLGSAVAFGLSLPLMELSQRKAKVAMTYTVVMEMQLVIGFFATAFCTVGMAVNKDFQAIAREAKECELGEARYYVVLIWASIMFQLSSLGMIGSIFYGSALLAGIIQSALLPVIQVLALVLFHDRFNGNKGVALALALWGSASYFYGEFKANKGPESVH